MTGRIYIRCPICDKITLLRYQFGYLEEHPIRFRCGYCGIPFVGKYSKADGIRFSNGTVVASENEPITEYVIASSGELLSAKLRKVNEFQDTIGPSPFITACMVMGNGGYVQFAKNMSNVLSFKGKKAYLVQNINELYFRRDHDELLRNHISKILDKEYFPTETEMDILRAVHHLNILPFITYAKEDFERATDFINKSISRTIDKNMEQLEGVTKCLVEKGYLSIWEKQAFMMHSLMLQKIDIFIPIIGYKSYEMSITEIEEKFSITTTSFEDIQQLYVNLYELIADMIPLVVGIDNIVCRNDYTILKPDHEIWKRKGGKISTFQEFIELREKGARINYLDGSSEFENLIFNILDRDVRNAIGHFSYEDEDAFDQIIRFKTEKKNMPIIEKSLIRVCIEVWEMYICVFTLSELIYNLKRIWFAMQGIRASRIKAMPMPTDKASQDDKKKKIGRNELCPCGSELKYKKCCGK